MINLNTYFNQTISLVNKSGVDLYGKTIDGEAVDINVRFQSSTKRLHDVKGEEFVADAEVWMWPDTVVDLNDRIIVDNVKYKIARIDTKRDFDGTKHHKKAWVVRVA